MPAESYIGLFWMVYGVVEVGVSIRESKRAVIRYLTVVCVCLFAPCMFKWAPLIWALQNVSLLRAVCMRPQITAHDLRQVCRKGTAVCILRVHANNFLSECLCVQRDWRLRLKSVSVSVCVRIKQQDWTLRLISESVSVCVCVYVPGWVHGLCSPIPDYPKSIFLLPTGCVTSRAVPQWHHWRSHRMSSSDCYLIFRLQNFVGFNSKERQRNSRRDYNVKLSKLEFYHLKITLTKG